jgi:chromate transport protein ChrA
MKVSTLWILCWALATYIGYRKGRMVLGFSLGLLFSALGLLVIAFIPSPYKRCQNCDEVVKKDVTVCPKCHNGE